MRLNTLFFAVSICAAGLSTGCGVSPEGSALAEGLKGGGWEQAHPFATVCDPVCVPTNGTCKPDCTIECKPGFSDCNGSVADGCECASDPMHKECGAGCTGTQCMPAKAVNAPCNRDCVMNAVCNAMSECTGEPAPDGTYCAHPPSDCPTAGVCTGAYGTCVCPTGSGTTMRPDMTTNTSGGAPDESGCNVSGTNPTDALATLLIGLACLFFIRRSRASVSY
jgi:MYXO-CTERM domain-containing protein